MTRHIPTTTLFCSLALALASPALAGDVSVQLDAGTGFSLKNSTGAIERLRVDEATGNISRNGALFVHTTGINNLFVGPGAGNTSTAGYANSAFGYDSLRSNTAGRFNSAVGFAALHSNTTGSSNSAVGYAALRSNTTGVNNSAFGFGALSNNSTGRDNSAFGLHALSSNITGNDNSAFGNRALVFNATGGNNSAFGGFALRGNDGFSNSAFGFNALFANTTGGNNSAFGNSALESNTTGNGNVAMGIYAGRSQTTGSNNIYLANTGVAAESGQIKIGTAGTHARAFIAGIRGATTVNANAIPVLIDSAGQLGTVSSSLSVKTDIRDMGDATARLLELRPVTFRYREQSQTLPGGGEAPPEYGLVAEEVARVFPDLVVYDEQGRPFTVKYHEMTPMLLNEMKRQRAAHEREVAALRTRLARLEERSRETAR